MKVLRIPTVVELRVRAQPSRTFNYRFLSIPRMVLSEALRLAAIGALLGTVVLLFSPPVGHECLLN